MVGGVKSGSKGRCKRRVLKRKERELFRTIEAMDFDPKTSVLHSQKKVDVYLAMYVVRLSSNVPWSVLAQRLLALSFDDYKTYVVKY